MAFSKAKALIKSLRGQNEASSGLADALSAGGFVGEEAARSAALSDGEFNALEEEVAAYQTDYAATLAYCQQFDDGSEEEGSCE